MKDFVVSHFKVSGITGAYGGLGYSISKKFASAGFSLALIGRDIRKLEYLRSVTNKLSSNMKVVPVKCDVRNGTDIRNAVSLIEKSFGKIDILINNAGIRIEASAENMNLSEWKDVIDTNLTGTFLMTKYALPLLKKAKNAVIINISSVRGLYGGKNLSAYSASKFGVIGFSQSLAEELKYNGIKVYSICPAAMDTEMIKNVKHNIPQEKLIQPDKMADIIYNIATNSKEPTRTTFTMIGRQTEILKKIEERKNYKIIQWE